MKISEVSVAAPGGAPPQLQQLVLQSDSGTFGVSELGVSDGQDGAEGIASRLRELLLGRDPFAVEAVWADVVDRGSGDDLMLVSAATSAMLDLAAKDLETPIFQLLGGAVRESVRACAIDWGEGATGPEEVVEAARRTVASGYTLLRVDPFTTSHSRRSSHMAAATELVQAIRTSVPDEVDLVVTADTTSSAETDEFIEAIAAAEPLWVEFSVESSRSLTGEEMGAVAWAMGRGADRGESRRLVIDNVVDHLVLEVDRIGGILEARRIAALAEVFYTGIVTACATGPLPLRDALSVAAVVPNLSAVEVRPGLAAVEGGMLSLEGFLDAASAAFDQSGIGT
jgi:galactonate dehydratase